MKVAPVERELRILHPAHGIEAGRESDRLKAAVGEHKPIGVDPDGGG